MSLHINIDPQAGELPAVVSDPRLLMLQPPGGQLSGLILANIAALVGATRLAAIITALPFTRPADTTAYASGDLVANNVTAGSVVPIALTAAARTNAGIVSVRRVRLKKSGTSVTNATFRVHLFGALPVPAVGDNTAISTTGAGAYLGACDIGSMQAFTDGAVGVAVPLVGVDILGAAGAGVKTLYALLEARGAYTPASAETFTLTAEVLQS